MPTPTVPEFLLPPDGSTVSGSVLLTWTPSFIPPGNDAVELEAKGASLSGGYADAVIPGEPVQLEAKGASRSGGYAEAEIPGEGGGDGLTKTAHGLLARYEAGSGTHPFDTDDWSAPGLFTLSLDEGALLCERTGGTQSGWRAIRCDPVAASSAPRHVQAVVMRDNDSPSVSWGGVVLRLATDNFLAFVTGGGSVGRSTDRHILAARDDSSTETHLQSVANISPQKVRGEPYRLSLAVEGDWDYRSYDFDADHTMSGTGDEGEVSPGGVGFAIDTGASAGSDFRLDEFYVTAGARFSVSGLPSGATVQVLDASENVLTSAEEDGGTAVVDMLAVAYPDAVEVVVRDDGDSVLATLTPENGVWGGDAYTYAEPE